jgi:PAS domain S-box-containing protein
MKTKLYALFLEDVKKDTEILQEMLTDEGFDIQMDIVETEYEYVSKLKQNNYDIIFADFTLPNFNGQEALELAKMICPNIPFICISGTIGEDRAVELLKQGATDYVLKDRMERLAFATKRALEAVVHLSKFRQTEIELQTNRRLLQTIINNALDSIYIKDTKGRYILFNEAAEKAIGKTATEVIGKDDRYIFSAAEAKMTMEIDKKVIEGGVPITSEESFTLIDGNVHYFNIIKCPMFDDSGKPSGLFGIARDITERKQMELSLLEAKEKAEVSDRLKTAFLQNISHEIRTPMNAIIGFSQLLDSAEYPDERRSEFTTIIQNSSHQLLSIVNNIITISSLEINQEKLTVTSVSIDSIFIDLLALFKQQALDKNISLHAHHHLKGTIIYTDGTKITQILTNLINNALKFTEKGSIEFGYIIKTNKEPAEIEFYVKDSGIGIKDESHTLIFERFCQADKDIQQTYGGTGLGLSISKGFIELLGGKIWVESELDKGSSFYFTIPYNPIGENNKMSSKTDHGLNIKTILIAEDDDYNFRYINEILIAMNVHSIHAKDGNETVEICKANPNIDLILMDIKMPKMDGHTAAKLIKEFRPDLPIIAQTAYALEHEKQKYSGTVFADYITKPINREELKCKIEKYSEKHNLSS